MRQQRGRLMESRNRERRQPVHRGDSVTVFPRDKRDRAGQLTTGIHGVVINEPREPGYAVEVVTLQGVLVTGQQKKKIFFSTDQYQIADPQVSFDPSLVELQGRVRRGEFDRATERKVTMKIAHGEDGEVGADSRRCTCRSANCCTSVRCGCYKANEPCTSRCACRGTCGNPY